MWHLLYNALLILAAPVILVVLLAKQRCRRGLRQRLGLERGLSGRPDRPDKPVIWIHAVSLGEVVAVAPIVKALARRHPEHRFVVSTVTETGREAVEQRLAGVAEHLYAPLDFPWVIGRVIERLRPSLYLFVETELWPNLLRQLRQHGVPTILLNGRLSSRSFARQQIGLVRSFYGCVLSTVSMCLMQSDRDAERIIALGADPAGVRRTGNIKFDQPMPADEQRLLSKSSLGLDADDKLFVAGSTHPGEEDVLVAAYLQVIRVQPSLVLVLAPRHIERSAQVEAALRSQGLAVRRRSRSAAGTPWTQAGPRVVILDTRGELAGLYREAVVAFVGGTLVPVGGHNLLEPAMWGKPVLFGPYTDHCVEVADLLLQAGGGCQIKDEAALVAQLQRLLQDQATCDRLGAAARDVVRQNQGAIDRSLDVIESFLPSPGRNGEAAPSAGAFVLAAGRRG